MEPKEKNLKNLEEISEAPSSNNRQENIIDGVGLIGVSVFAYSMFSNPVKESIQNTTNTFYNFCQTVSSYIDFLS
ncbi:hypothetical protein HOE04_02310 [archaeon]|jgi:hypothetical protein|nr:hypothetical protein [archaeon]